MCEFCEGEHPRNIYEKENDIVGSVRFVHICKGKPYLSLSTKYKIGATQKYIKVNYCMMCGRKLKEDK